MKATLEFDDKHDLLLALSGPEAFTLLSEIDNMLRTQLKHGEPEKDRETLESIRADIRDPSGKDVCMKHCTGPCHQGDKPCPCPMACESPDSDELGVFEILGKFVVGVLALALCQKITNGVRHASQ